MPRWKQIRRALRRPFETGGFVLFKWVIPLLPRRAVVGMAKLAGRIMWLLPLREKKIGLENLDAVFGDTKTAAEKRFILTTSFTTFSQTMLDVLWFSKYTKKRIPRYVTVSPEFEQALRDKAFVCITAHFGNWEILGQTAAFLGTDISSIAATIKNKQVDKLFCDVREQTGQTIIPQKGAMRTVISRLRKGGKVAFVLDQNTDETEGGITVDFLGLPMSVSSAPAALAYRTGIKIIFAFCIPQAGGKYLLQSLGKMHPPEFDKQEDADRVARELTQQIQDRISEQIRTQPEYWLWSYKHWRRNPGNSYPANYPDY